MNVRNDLHDSGLTDSRFLARLVQASVIVLDSQSRVCFASPGACELLGVTDESELRERWAGIAAQLQIDAWAPQLIDGSPYRARANIEGPEGLRALRFEVHGVSGSEGTQRIVLLRERDKLLPSDRALLLASEAQANRHALTGLVHAAKGPLNNFTLTLALLAGTIERSDFLAASAATRTRLLRYVDVLRSETTRLAAGLEEINALATPRPAAHEAFDIGALARDIVRVLHHEATMRELHFEALTPERPVNVAGDAQLLRLALLAFTICVFDFTPAGARVSWTVTPAADGPSLARAAVAAASGRFPADFASSLFRLTCTAESPYCAAIAARMIIEAHGGSVSIDSDPGAPAGFVLQLRPPA